MMPLRRARMLRKLKKTITDATIRERAPKILRAMAKMMVR